MSFVDPQAAQGDGQGRNGTRHLLTVVTNQKIQQKHVHKVKYHRIIVKENFEKRNFKMMRNITCVDMKKI